MRERLTKARIDRLIAQADATEKLHYDTEIPGFHLRLRNGRATFGLEYRRAGRVRRLTIGRYPGMVPDRARVIARDLYGVVQAGGDPAADRRAERQRKLTAGGLFAAYLTDFENRVQANETAGNGRSRARRGRRSTLAEFRRTATASILPELGRIEVERLNRATVKRWHKSLEGTPTVANRALTLLGAVLGFGEREEIIPAGARARCVGQGRAAIERHPEAARGGKLTDAEIEKVGAALRAAEQAGTVRQSVGLALRVMLFTGLRRSEVLGHVLAGRRTAGEGLRWGDVDLEAGILTVRQGKAGSRTVVLGAAAIKVLRAAGRHGPNADAPVCPGARLDQPLVGFEKLVRPIFDRAGVPWRGCHAFRRTFASKAGERFGAYVIGALLGRGKATVTDRYVEVELAPIRAAANRVAGALAAALNGTRAKVLEGSFGTGDSAE